MATRRDQARAIGAALLILATAGAPRADARAVPDSLFGLDAAPPVSETAPESLRAAAEMRAVPAGRYPIGRDGGAGDQAPAHEVSLAAFRIDRTEVTNAAFAEFLNAPKPRIGLGLTPRRATIRRGSLDHLWSARCGSPTSGGVCCDPRCSSTPPRCWRSAR